MTAWFRMYNEALDNPKIQRLPDPLFKTWVNLLCIAARFEGELPAAADLAFLLRLDDEETRARLEKLVEAGLLDRSDDGLEPHNWRGRQHQSDDSAPRVRKHREAKRAAAAAHSACNGDNAVTVTPPETETETETDSDLGKASAFPVDGSPPTGPATDFTSKNEARAGNVVSIDQAQRERKREGLRTLGTWWNRLAAELNLRPIEAIKPGSRRERCALARIREFETDFGSLGEGLVALGEKIRGSPLLRGRKSDWRAHFDWVLKPENYQKIIEGAYDEVRKAAR